MMTTRRQFVKALSFAAAAAIFAEDHKAAGLPIAFSTLGCPEWGLEKILGFANSHGFAAIELRGLQGTMDLPSHPVFARDRIRQKIFAYRERLFFAGRSGAQGNDRRCETRRQG